MSFLVAIDLSAPSYAAIEVASWLGKALGEDVWLLHVSPGQPSLELLAALYQLAAPLREAGVPARLRTVSGAIAPQIIHEARRRGCRWILTGTSGTRDDGSVARALMARSALPVLAVRPADAGLPRALPHISGVFLRAPPRSRAPLSWDIAGLLADTLRVPLRLIAAGETCGPDVCAADALVVLAPDQPINLDDERCTALLVSSPVPERAAGVAEYTA